MIRLFQRLLAESPNNCFRYRAFATLAPLRPCATIPLQNKVCGTKSIDLCLQMKRHFCSKKGELNHPYSFPTRLPFDFPWSKSESILQNKGEGDCVSTKFVYSVISKCSTSSIPRKLTLDERSELIEHLQMAHANRETNSKVGNFYFKLMKMAAQIPDPELIRDIMNFMTKFNVFVSFNHYSALLRAFIQTQPPSIDQWKATALEMQERGFLLGKINCTVAINAILNVKSDRSGKNAIVSTQQREMCDEIFEFAQDHKVQIDNVLINTIMRVYSMTKTPDCYQCERMFQYMQVHNIAPDHFTFYSIIRSYSRLDPPDVKMCYDVIDRMKKNGCKPNLLCFNMIIDAFSSCSPPDIQGCYRVFQNIIQSRLKPDVVTFNTLLKAHLQSNPPQVMECLTVLKKMKKSRIVPDSFTRNILFSAKVENSSQWIEMCSRMFGGDFGKKKNIEAYNAVLHEIASQKPPNIQKCEKVLEEIKKSNLRPSATTYLTLLTIYARQEPCQPLKCRQILFEMEKSSIVPTERHYAQLIKSMIKQPNPDLEGCREVIQNMVSRGIKPNIFIFTMMLGGISYSRGSNNYEKVNFVLDEMKKSNVRLDAIACHALLNIYANRDPPDVVNCLDIIQYMNTENLKITNETAILIVHGFLSYSPPQVNECVQFIVLLRSMGLKPQDELLKRILSCATHMGDQTILHALDSFVSFDLHERPSVCALIIEFIARNPSQLDKFHQHLEKIGKSYIPTTQVVDKIIFSFVKSNDAQGLLRFLQCFSGKLVASQSVDALLSCSSASNTNSWQKCVELIIE